MSIFEFTIFILINRTYHLDCRAPVVGVRLSGRWMELENITFMNYLPNCIYQPDFVQPYDCSSIHGAIQWPRGKIPKER